MLAAAAVVAGAAVSLGEARRAFNLYVVRTIAASIGLGAAVQSGPARRRSRSAGEPFGHVGQLAAVLLATMRLTELLSNHAAAALMIPAGLFVAATSNADARAFAVAVLVDASCSFLSPVGYRTNVMVYGLGSHRLTDLAPRQIAAYPEHGGGGDDHAVGVQALMVGDRQTWRQKD